MDEKARLKNLNEYRILDTNPEASYDSITRLASFICKTPVALISFIDDRRLWIKSEVGLGGLKEAAKTESVCQTTLLQDSLLEVPDLKQDKRFARLPSVLAENGMRYYAGCPLVTPEGYHIGTLCVNDFEPRQLTDDQKLALETLAREVMAHLEVARKNRALRKALKKAKRYENLFNNSSGIHLITNDEAIIEFVNSSASAILGFDEEELLGNKIWNFCCEGEKEAILPDIRYAIERGEDRFEFETKVLTKQGLQKWMSWCGVVKNRKWLINGIDVTHRKEHEGKIRSLSLALEKSSAGVIMRNPTGEIHWMNKAAEDIIGYNLQELRGRTFGSLLVGPKTDISAIEEARAVISNEKPYELEVVLYKKDKTPLWVYSSNYPLYDDSGQLDKHVSILVDISERKLAEAQLIKTKEDAVKLSKAKESFLSVMSHEMRTPLNAVIGMTRILKDEEPLERQQKNLDILDFSAQNLLTLINDVLDFTKIETGNLQLESIPVKIEELANQTIESLQFKTENKELKVSYEIGPDVPKVILGDSTRLYQIFMNLLGNAVKFTERGEVKLSIDVVAQNEKTADLRFEVSDTGIGIPANKLATIFDAYTQADTDTARKYGGTGLGLAITKKLISLHGASIKVESEIGKGTKFYFTVQFNKANAGTADKIEAVRELPLSGKVLVVDDNHINRLLARKVLDKWKLDIEFAENGLEAVEKVKSGHFDLVLMDVYMPVMDGLEATELIRNLPDEIQNQLPIIALTGSVGEEDQDKYVSAGMNDYILKPFEPSVLYRKISPFLAGELAV